MAGFFSRFGDHVWRETPLVRPFVKLPYPERHDAGPPVLAERADCCPSLPLTVFRAVVLHGRDSPVQLGTAAVVDLNLCGHHATRHEAGTERARWVLVLDRRQSFRDAN